MHPYPFLSLLFVLVVCNHNAVSRESCISEYTAFEEGTFKNNSRNRHELYKAFYPPNGHLPFSVKVNYQSASPNGTMKLILVNASGYINDEWIWLSSPVFYFVRPEYLNEARRLFPEGADTVPYALYLSGIGLVILPGIPTAIYFTCTSKPPAIPSIFYMPVSIIFCCNTRYGKSLVFAAGVFALTVSFQCFSVTAMLTTFVAFAEPFAIITNSLVVALLVFCLVNCVALIFTISAYVFTPKGHQTAGGKFVIARKAFIVIPLQAMVCCYCAVLGAGGYTVNVDTKQGSIRSILGSLTVPVILGATTFGMKKLITKSLDRSNVNDQPNNSEGKEESHKSYTSMLHEDDQLLDP